MAIRERGRKPQGHSWMRFFYRRLDEDALAWQIQNLAHEEAWARSRGLWPLNQHPYIAREARLQKIAHFEAQWGKVPDAFKQRNPTFSAYSVSQLRVT
jgi:ADP-ribose pyrophosphatase YjhB (NUDIX family)